jgi:hypothetical protein
LVARPTAAHTGGCLFLKRRRLGSLCHNGSARVRGPIPGLAARFFTFWCAYPSPYSIRNDGRFWSDLRVLDFWVFTSGVPVLSEAGFDPEAYVLRAGSLPCELRFAARPTVAHTGGYLLLASAGVDSRVQRTSKHHQDPETRRSLAVVPVGTSKYFTFQDYDTTLVG